MVRVHRLISGLGVSALHGTGPWDVSGLGVVSFSCCCSVFHLCCLGGGVPANGGEGVPYWFSGFSPGDLLEWGHQIT